MEHSKPLRPHEPQPVAERDDVRLVANRCPFCRTDVDVEQNDWVSCRSCQARNHTACWNEAGACSACGETRYLGTVESEPSGAAQRPQHSSAIVSPERLVSGVGLVAVITIGLVASLTGDDAALGLALSAAAAASLACTVARLRASYAIAAFFAALGLGFGVCWLEVPHIHAEHPEVPAFGGVFFALGLVIAAVARIRRSSDSEA